ncbi:hypothetical protein [Natrialba taiwanensis]|nr:hypothetical protein [Natrialba taiwanensis]
MLASYAALLALSGITMLVLGIGALLVTSSEPRVQSSESPRSQ